MFEETFAAFKEYYGAHCLDHTAPYPDIMQMMKALKENGVKIAIVSNKLDSAVKELNKQFFAAYTTSAIGEMDGVARKPAPDMVNKALRELGVDKEDAVYVGDYRYSKKFRTPLYFCYMGISRCRILKGARSEKTNRKPA